jgi:hypothetical protein
VLTSFVFIVFVSCFSPREIFFSLTHFKLVYWIYSETKCVFLPIYTKGQPFNPSIMPNSFKIQGGFFCQNLF